MHAGDPIVIQKCTQMQDLTNSGLSFKKNRTA